MSLMIRSLCTSVHRQCQLTKCGKIIRLSLVIDVRFADLGYPWFQGKCTYSVPRYHMNQC